MWRGFSLCHKERREPHCYGDEAVGPLLVTHRCFGPHALRCHMCISKNQPRIPSCGRDVDKPAGHSYGSGLLMLTPQGASAQRSSRANGRDCGRGRMEGSATPQRDHGAEMLSRNSDTEPPLSVGPPAWPVAEEAGAAGVACHWVGVGGCCDITVLMAFVGRGIVRTGLVWGEVDLLDRSKHVGSSRETLRDGAVPQDPF